MDTEVQVNNSTTMIIIKYYEWLRIQELMQPKTGLKPDLRDSVYELVDEDFKKIRKLSKQEAVELIQENHLIRVHRDNNGAIWR